MTTGDFLLTGPSGYPNWLPTDVKHYLVHTLEGRSIRALSRAAGVHASTILRQVRRNESRRDDPLLDTALDRLAERIQGHGQLPREDQELMMARSKTSNFPDEKKIESEARRILRRLAEPDAILAIAPMMEKAVVVREMADGRTVKTAVVDREIAEIFVVKDWIELRKKAKVARYGVSQAGRAALKRLLAEIDTAKQGFAEAQTPFGDQHREWDDRVVKQGEGRVTKRIRYNVAESPLTSMARRKTRDGKPYLDVDLVAAGERLREDFEMSQMGPRVAQNWDRFLTTSDRGSFSGGNECSGSAVARDRVANALKELGPGLGDVVLRVCCFLEGMEQAEKRMGWSARSGKIVLKIALQRLARHYSDIGRNPSLIG